MPCGNATDPAVIARSIEAEAHAIEAPSEEEEDENADEETKARREEMKRLREEAKLMGDDASGSANLMPEDYVLKYVDDSESDEDF